MVIADKLGALISGSAMMNIPQTRAFRLTNMNGSAGKDHAARIGREIDGSDEEIASASESSGVRGPPRSIGALPSEVFLRLVWCTHLRR